MLLNCRRPNGLRFSRVARDANSNALGRSNVAGHVGCKRKLADVSLNAKMRKDECEPCCYANCDG